MTAVLLFAATLLVAALLSARAQRTALSISVLFLAVGFVAGQLGWIRVSAQSSTVTVFADVALSAVLFSDGMRITGAGLRRDWGLPGRALLLGFPLSLLALALLAHWAAGLAWAQAVLLAAVLTPTDPVFAASMVKRDEVSMGLRRLLNVESGVNDGLALPIVVGMLAILDGSHGGFAAPVLDVMGGAALGVLVPWAADRVRAAARSRLEGAYTALFTLAVGILVYAVAKLTHTNEYIAAFCAGATLASCGPRTLTEEFAPLGEHLCELLKFATLLAFGAMLTPALFAGVSWGGWVFVGAALLLARPLAMAAALWRSGLRGRERAAAGWFGPKGFASVVYAFLVLRTGVAGAESVFALAAVVVAVSIVVHSSSDVPVARWLGKTSA
ncbi:cation:proton antiporter domain-containing protein [Ramlibacter sp. AN1133]|uniref:cation:proton antiporter domain-containing protein n=1 Tax=Ramlibacter sp. AN1133 TaxID=3133429 RepID=UPI0030BCD036